MKTFIAISSLIYQNKLVYLTTSTGENLFCENGISTFDAIKFLHSLYRKRTHKSNLVFICYAVSRDNEFAFSLLPNELKDKLFQSRIIKEQLKELEYIQQENKAEFYKTKDEARKDYLDFDIYTNDLSIKELETVDYYGFNLTLVNGKFLTIRKNKKSITIYDVYGFFRKPLYDAAKDWLKQDIKVLAGKKFIKDLELLKQFTELETGVICELTEQLNNSLLQNGIKLSKFHGASAVSSQILSSSGAKKEFHSYKSKHQTSGECYKASQQAFHGARTEQHKIGTLKDIKVYDINSAYAYAALFLPKFLRKPIFTKTYNIEPFSWWFVEYDFSKQNLYYGLLPNREKFGNSTTYKTRGKGYYYQPEIEFVLNNYPDCIDIKQGFYVPFEQAAFTNYILTIYELRKQLKKQGNPLEKVLKLALAGLYGKFCQHQGRGYYYNFYYAGFITSKVRATLLENTKDKENKTICFLTDAIHSLDTLPNVVLSDEIGEFRLKEYESGTYYGLGVYDLIDKDGQHKQAHQGFNEFDFVKALIDIKDKRIYTGLQELFTGWNVYTEHLFKGNYLEDYSQNKANNPFETSARLFDLLDVNLSQTFIDSKISHYYGGLESGLYKETNYKESNYALDTIRAKRI